MKYKKILLIEDNVEYSEMLVDILKKENKEYEIMVVNSYAELAPVMKRTIYFDLIISDIEIPEISGITIVKMLNSLGILKITPLLIYSGVFNTKYLEDKELINDLDSTFFYDFVEKGHIKWLLFKIKQLLKLRSLYEYFSEIK